MNIQKGINKNKSNYMGFFKESLDRLRKKAKESSNKTEVDVQMEHLKLLKKLYNKKGLELTLTSRACPEQYSVYKNGKEVGYYRLRHGIFRVDYPVCKNLDNKGRTIFTEYTIGDGQFDDDERVKLLVKALRMIILEIEKEEKSKACISDILYFGFECDIDSDVLEKEFIYNIKKEFPSIVIKSDYDNNIKTYRQIVEISQEEEENYYAYLIASGLLNFSSNLRKLQQESSNVLNKYLEKSQQKYPHLLF